MSDDLDPHFICLDILHQVCDYYFLKFLRPRSLTVLLSLKAVPEPASQDPKDVVDSELLNEKPKITISFIRPLTGKSYYLM